MILLLVRTKSAHCCTNSTLVPWISYKKDLNIFFIGTIFYPRNESYRVNAARKYVQIITKFISNNAECRGNVLFKLLKAHQ